MCGCVGAFACNCIFLCYIAPTHSAADIVVIEETHPTSSTLQHELIQDKDEAWDFYQKFIKAEKKVRRRRAHVDALEFFGDASTFCILTKYFIINKLFLIITMAYLDKDCIKYHFAFCLICINIITLICN